MKLILKIFIFFVLSVNLFAQSTYYSPEDTLSKNNFIKTDLYNDNNAANFNSLVKIDYSKKKLKLSLYNNYNSQVTKLSDNYVNDYNNLEVKSTYSIYKNFYSGGGINSKVLSGNQTSGLNKGQNNFFYSAFDFLPNDKFSFKSKFGITDEKQLGVDNTGFSGRVLTNLDNINISDFISSGKLYLSLDNFSEKTNYDYEINSNVKKQFSENSDNEGILRAFVYRSDFYTPATQSIRNEYGVNNNIQSRIENYFLLNDKLNYQFTKKFRIKVNGLFYLKNISNSYKYKPNSGSFFMDNIYDYHIKENLLQAGTELEYTAKLFTTRLNVFYMERDETHIPQNIESLSPSQRSELEKIEKDKNNNSKTTTAFIEIYYHPSNTNAFRIQGASSLLRYDTNSDLNFDDRDELSYNASISHRFNNYNNFYLESTFEITNSKLNYIFKEKSSNNYTNKIYKLSSVSLFKPNKILTTKNYFQVLANYTVYKYESIVSQVQSFSFRQLLLSDSTQLNMTKNFATILFGELRLYEQGQFNNEKFSVNPTAFYDERTLGNTFSYNFNNTVNLFIGFRHYIRRYFLYEKNQKNLKRTQAVYGPYAGVEMNIKNNSTIYILGGIDNFEVSDNPLTTTSKNLIIKILWNL